MLEFLVDNIFLAFTGKAYQQIFVIPKGTKCVPLLGDIFLYSYEAEFMKSFLSTGKKQYTIAPLWCFVHKQSFRNLGQVYLVEIEIKDTTESIISASSLVLTPVDREGRSPSPCHIHDKHDNLKFHKTNFPFLSSNFHVWSSMAFSSHSIYDLPELAPGSLYGCFILRQSSILQIAFKTIWSFPFTNV